MPAYYIFLITLITLLIITWTLMANSRNRIWVTAQQGIDPFDMWITLVPYIGLSLIGMLGAIIINDLGLQDRVNHPVWFWISAGFGITFIGSLAFALLMGLIGGQTIPYLGYRPHWWKELRAYRLAHLSHKGITSTHDIANIENLYIGLRTWPLPTNNPHAQDINPHTKHTTRPINTSTMLEGRELPPYTYPTGPAPTACEIAIWAFSVDSDAVYREYFPSKPLDRLRIRGTVTGDFTFTGLAPEGAMLWRAEQKFFEQGPKLTPPILA
ncbi:hypothetical protein ACN082_08090 [Rothia sp. CCM 9417]|uniref:hypothetical protein n=1 Tax=Rothia sp. CCM 9417 TaxID=3402657 RepID=UPI003AE7F392